MANSTIHCNIQRTNKKKNEKELKFKKPGIWPDIIWQKYQKAKTKKKKPQAVKNREHKTTDTADIQKLEAATMQLKRQAGRRCRNVSWTFFLGFL